jgi:ubiquinone biosynthesis protein UbiJ
MSHVVLAERNGDGAIVEKIHDVISVDAVVGPATTRTFRESVDVEGTSKSRRSETGESAVGQELDGLGRPPYGEEEIELLQEQISALKAERDELRMRLDRLEAEAQTRASQAQVERLLAEAQLPDFAVTAPFMEQLATAADDAARRVLIGERSTLVRRAAQSRPNSAERATDQDRRNSNAEFVAAIRAGRGPVGAVVW